MRTLGETGRVVKKAAKWKLILPIPAQEWFLMSDKKERMRAFAATFSDSGRWDPRYWGYFITFNQGRYFEAHDVLEDLWLECRKQRLDTFYKALIQLAGVFVHLQKQRLRPARALMDLSQGYLHAHGPVVEGLSLGPVHALLDQWRVRIAGLESLDFHQYPPPRLLMPEQGLDV